MCIQTSADDFDPSQRPLFDQPFERDLRRIATNRALMPPPRDPNDSRWRGAWDYFGRIYTPALEAYVAHVLGRWFDPAFARQEAQDIVGAFVTTRLEDGRLEPPGQRIQRFRSWLAAQLRAFAIDHLRRESAQRRRPAGGFVSESQLLELEDDGPWDEAQAVLDAQFVQDVLDAVLADVTRISEKQAILLRDLVRGDGAQSADIAAQVGLATVSVRSLRRRARDSFRKALLAVVQSGLFSPADTEDLIAGLRKRFQIPVT